MGDPPASGADAALVLLGHGARSVSGRRQFLETADQLVHLLPGVVVRHAFLEASAPSLLETLDQLAGQGVRRIRVAPLLLLAAGHVRRDIPALVAQFHRCRPETQVTCLPALGCHRRVIDLMGQRVAELLGQGQADPAQACLLVVGRGSAGGQTNRALRRLTQRVAAAANVPQWHIGLLALAQPSLETALAEVAALRCPWVVVQPHLLFEGALIGKLRRTIKEQDQLAQRQRYLLGDVLGGGEPLARAVAERFLAAGRRERQRELPVD